MAKSLINLLKRYFLAGLLVVLPMGLTVVVIVYLFQFVDGLLKPIITHLLGYYWVGLGLIITLLIILLAGLLTRNILGKSIHKLIETVLARLPLISPIYSGAKQLLEAVTIPSKGSFKEVVLVEYPRTGVYAVGLVTRRMEILAEGKLRTFACVLIASTPTPFSGMAILYPVDEIIEVDMTVEDALKFLVSGGVVSPQTVQEKTAITHT
ncbi:MAG TPA: DUF502 domain-containing protein [candidate division Zixibacteria bacterium]|nr:DUF502 domain-containing protein [candidate division Zixibacteria bacterium]